jgi:CheY-like chemotaxis protein
MATRRGTVLLVDDDLPFLLSLSDGLATWAPELEVVTASSGVEALRLLADRPVDVLATDLRMPGVDGFSLIKRARQRQPGLPVVVITALRQSEVEAQLAPLAPLVVMDKPLDLPQLVAELQQALQAADTAGAGVSRG